MLSITQAQQATQLAISDSNPADEIEVRYVPMPDDLRGPEFGEVLLMLAATRTDDDGGDMVAYFQVRGDGEHIGPIVVGSLEELLTIPGELHWSAGLEVEAEMYAA